MERHKPAEQTCCHTFTVHGFHQRLCGKSGFHGPDDTFECLGYEEDYDRHHVLRSFLIWSLGHLTKLSD